MSADLYPDLPAEQAHLAASRAARLRMIADLQRARSTDSAADEITQQYIEMTAEIALTTLEDPASAEFFGRIDAEDGERFHIGRRHIEGAEREPIVVDWRADIAAPFYRATVSDSYGLRRRRRFTTRESALIAYNDEHLDDPTAADIAGGIPDPVLAEIGSARTGAMRDIVATIQAEQDVIIRSPIETCMIVQGGPGTGKTAVGLHRVAFLMFEHRAKLGRESVLVVGPNRVFLDYISNVLPSLGERSVEQRTLADLLQPRVTIDAVDADDVIALKGDRRMAELIARAAHDRIRPPAEPLRFPLGVRTITVEPDDLAAWAEDAARGSTPLNQRRAGFRILVEQSLGRKLEREVKLGAHPVLRAALDKMWPTIAPLPLVRALLRGELPAESGLEPHEIARFTARRKGLSLADAVLVDEANNLLNGPPRSFGHVVIDEAQDLTELGLRVVARRCPSRSLTILGDLAQSTEPGGQVTWDAALAALGQPAGAEVAHLTIGYRVPGPILEVANRLLDDAQVSVPASRSARSEGREPVVIHAPPSNGATSAVATVRAMRQRHRLTGLIVPAELADEATDALRADGWRPSVSLHGLADDEVPVIIAEMAKGLELDGVVVLEPAMIHRNTARGARLLYIAMTRAVQELALVTTTPLPASLGV